MTPVQFHFVTPDGDPVANTEVEIQLTQSGFDLEESGVLLPRQVLATTDADGKVTVPLWPNPKMYVVSLLDPTSDAGLSYRFYVPETEPGLTIRLQDIVVDGPMSETEWDTVAIQAILDAKAGAIAAWNGALVAEAGAIAAAGDFGDAAAQAAASEAASIISQAARDAAVISATGAATSAAAALVSQNTATARAAAALVSQNGAATSHADTLALAPYFGPTPQPDPVINATWINSVNGRRYTYLFDGTSSQWVETGAVVVIGSDTAAAALASADAAAASASAAAASASLTGLANAVVDGSYNLLITRSNGTVYTAGYVRGPAGAAFTVNAIGTNLAGRAAYNSQADGFSYLDSTLGNLYFRQTATAGTWSPAIAFGKGDKGDAGTTDFNALINKPVLGTSASLNAPASGNASAGEVVKGTDTRLTDARTPSAHTHLVAAISDASTIGKALMVASSAGAGRTALGLQNVDNTADVDKEISNAVNNALSNKANNGANYDITELTNLTTPLAVSMGGTGGNDVLSARDGLLLPRIAGRINRIDNGNFIINQRGLGAVTGNGLRTADRWSLGTVGSVGLSVSRNRTQKGDTCVLSMQCTAPFAPTALQYSYVNQGIEGYDIADFYFGTAAAQPLTLSFWSYSNVMGPFSVSLRNSGSSRSFVQTYTVNAPNTWEKQTIAVPPDTAGTWLIDANLGMVIGFAAAVGSTYLTPNLGVWQAGNYLGGAGATNLMTATGRLMLIDSVQLERGSVATPYERVSYADSLLKCMRFFEIVGGISHGAKGVYIKYGFMVPKRTVPVLSVTGGNAMGADTQPQLDGFYCPYSVPATGTSGWAIAASSEL